MLQGFLPARNEAAMSVGEAGSTEGLDDSNNEVHLCNLSTINDR